MKTKPEMPWWIMELNKDLRQIREENRTTKKGIERYDK
jgi:hypothetical protein